MLFPLHGSITLEFPDVAYEQKSMFLAQNTNIHSNNVNECSFLFGDPLLFSFHLHYNMVAVTGDRSGIDHKGAAKKQAVRLGGYPIRILSMTEAKADEPTLDFGRNSCCGND